MNKKPIKKIRTKEWRIFHTNEDNKFKCITNHLLPIPGGTKADKMYSLKISLNENLKNFYRLGYNGKKLRHCFNLMREIRISAKKLSHKPITDVFETIKAMIPREFFGTHYHCKLFMKIVKRILTRSCYEYIRVREIVRNYDFELIPWLEDFDKATQINYLYFPLKWTLDAVKYLIRKQYYFLKHFYCYRVELVPHRVLSSFKQKVINIVEKKYVTPVNNIERGKIKGTVVFVPKEGFHKLKFRPILRMNYNRSRNSIRSYCQHLKDYASSFSKGLTKPFHRQWLSYTRSIGNKEIYCIRLDVSDAYGTVNIGILVKLINEMKAENSMKQNLINNIIDQYVTFVNPKNRKAQIYQWHHGLLQGDPFSGPLCNLYMSCVDSMALPELISDKRNFIHRTADDYVFVSTSNENVEKFLNIMNKFYTIKHSKIVTNVEILSCYKKTDVISYCGSLIDTNTKEIYPGFNFVPKTSLHGKYKLWNLNHMVDQQYFLIKAMRYSYNNNYFAQKFLNGFYNKPRTVVDNYFKAMVNLAFKFDVAVDAIYNPKSITDYGRVIGEVVVAYARKSFKTIRRHSNANTSESLKITLQMLIKVGYCAFFVVLRKRYEVYKKIVKEIRKVNDTIFIPKPFDVKRYLNLPEDFREIRMVRTVKMHG